MSEQNDRRAVRVFIASSGTVKHLAQKLADELQVYSSDEFKLEPVPWWKEPEGSYILDELVRKTKDCDFAAILLTEGDLDSGASDRVRDNCIYEAGLFTGALGEILNDAFLSYRVISENCPAILPA